MQMIQKKVNNPTKKGEMYVQGHIKGIMCMKRFISNFRNKGIPYALPVTLAGEVNLPKGTRL